MKKQILIGLALFAVVLGVVVWIAKPSQSENKDKNAILGSGGQIIAEELSFDFGSISMEAGKVSHMFIVKNTSDKPALLNKMYTSCMCTTAFFRKGDGEQFGPYGMQGHGGSQRLNQTVSPGEEAYVEVVFDPAAHGPAGVGRIERLVRMEVEGNDPVELQFSVVVTP
ncbi:MAG: DUF1573 domain-containing protein [Candidatus Wildermuthbacteria bacterium]|nr:DUF1573 domain-containing protein [Candidatus Wildermuthbacteria bacterium]